MPSKKKETKKMLRITLVKSGIGYSERHKATIKALGLRRMHYTVEQEDNATIRGMLSKIMHLVQIEEVNG